MKNTNINTTYKGISLSIYENEMMDSQTEWNIEERQKDYSVPQVRTPCSGILYLRDVIFFQTKFVQLRPYWISLLGHFSMGELRFKL